MIGDLLPCPFCGSDRVSRVSVEGFLCNACGADVIWSHGREARWNNRDPVAKANRAEFGALLAAEQERLKQEALRAAEAELQPDKEELAYLTDYRRAVEALLVLMTQWGANGCRCQERAREFLENPLPRAPNSCWP